MTDQICTFTIVQYLVRNNLFYIYLTRAEFCFILGLLYISYSCRVLFYIEIEVYDILNWCLLCAAFFSHHHQIFWFLFLFHMFYKLLNCQLSCHFKINLGEVKNYFIKNCHFWYLSGYLVIPYALHLAGQNYPSKSLNWLFHVYFHLQ